MPPLEVMAKVFTRSPNYIMQFQPYGPADWILARDVPAWLESLYLGPATRHPEVFTPDVLARYVEAFSQPGGITPGLDYYRNMDVNWRAAADLPERIELPALMVCAEHDPVLTPAMSEGMEAAGAEPHQGARRGLRPLDPAGAARGDQRRSRRLLPTRGIERRSLTSRVSRSASLGGARRRPGQANAPRPSRRRGTHHQAGDAAVLLGRRGVPAVAGGVLERHRARPGRRRRGAPGARRALP